MDAVRRWADDDLRSLNGQIEYLLREALRRMGRELKRSRRRPSSRLGPGSWVEPSAWWRWLWRGSMRRAQSIWIKSARRLMNTGTMYH
jgi:hypothetical protein